MWAVSIGSGNNMHIGCYHAVPHLSGGRHWVGSPVSKRSFLRIKIDPLTTEMSSSRENGSFTEQIVWHHITTMLPLTAAIWQCQKKIQNNFGIFEARLFQRTLKLYDLLKGC